jgi:thiamine biosynthesis lipoprotein
VTPAEPARTTLGLGETRPAGVQRFSHAAMATVFEVHCVHEDEGYARQAAHAAFSLLDRLEQDLSRFIPNSDVSRINGLAAGRSTRVSPWTLECLEIARDVHGLTGGAFDVSIGSGFSSLELVPDDFSVHAGADGVRLDLGGIGKGYAVDRMAELLEEWEIRSALVHGGFSSVLALEPPPDRDGWALTLSAPWPGDERVLARISAARQAFSASGVGKREHIVDPRTGRPARARAAWVAVPFVRRSAAALAEGLSTALMLLTLEEIEALWQNLPGVLGWLAKQPSAEDVAGAFVRFDAGRRTITP